MYFRNFVIISPWIEINLLYPKMICAKFGWNWPSGSAGGKKLKIGLCTFCTFVIISPWKKEGPFIRIPITKKMICAKFGWNWPSGSGEEDFVNLSMYYRYFVIISPWKRARTFIWTNLHSQGCFVPSLVEIGPVVLEKKKKMWNVCDNNDNEDNDSDNDDEQRTNITLVFGSGKRIAQSFVWIFYF